MNEPTTMLATPTSEAPTSSNASNTSATAEKLYGEQKASNTQTAPADTAKAQDAPVTGQAEKAAEAPATTSRPRLRSTNSRLLKVRSLTVTPSPRTRRSHGNSS